MSATKRLRELLDERGILYDTAYDVTMWTGSDGHGCTASEIFSRQNGKPTTKHLMIRRVMTPEQAIAATLGDTDATGGRQGDGTCHDMGCCRWFRCSACGFGIEDMYVNDEDEYTPAEQPRYCPNCGRKVVDE